LLVSPPHAERPSAIESRAGLASRVAGVRVMGLRPERVFAFRLIYGSVRYGDVRSNLALCLGGLSPPRLASRPLPPPPSACSLRSRSSARKRGAFAPRGSLRDRSPRRLRRPRSARVVPLGNGGPSPPAARFATAPPAAFGDLAPLA